MAATETTFDWMEDEGGEAVAVGESINDNCEMCGSARTEDCREAKANRKMTCTCIACEQDHPWSRYIGRCHACYEATRKAFPMMSWKQVLTKAEVSKDFQVELKNILRAFKKHGQKVKFPVQKVEQLRRNGYVLQRSAIFLDEDELKRDFKTTLKDLQNQGVKIEELFDENGKAVKGICVRDESKPYRKLKIFSEFGASMNEVVHAPENQLRAEQGMEVFDFVNEQRKHPPSAKITIKDLSTLVAKAEEENEERLRERKLADTLSAEAAKTPERPRRGVFNMASPVSGESEKEDEELSACNQDHTPPTESLRLSGANHFDSKATQLVTVSLRAVDNENKGLRLSNMQGQKPVKGRAEAKARAKRPNDVSDAVTTGTGNVHSSIGAPQSAHATSSAAASDLGAATSVVTGANSERSRSPARQKKCSTVGGGARDYKNEALSRLQSLNLTEVLSGKYNQEVYQAKRLMKHKEFDEHCAEGVELNAHLLLCEEAQVLAVDAKDLKKVPEDKRLKAIRTLAKERVQFPQQLQLNLLGIRLSSQLAAKPFSAEAVTSSMEPVTSEFDALCPKFWAVNMDDVTRGPFLQKTVISEILTPLVSQGQPRGNELLELCQLILRRLCSEEVLSTMGLVSAAAARTIRTAVQAILCLLDATVHDVNPLDDLLNATDAVTKPLRLAIVTSKHYSSIEAGIRRAQTASDAFLPQLRGLENELREALAGNTVTNELMEQCATSLPTWKDALREGATTQLEQLVLSGLEQLAATSLNIGSKEALLKQLATSMQALHGSKEQQIKHQKHSPNKLCHLTLGF
eukprot:6460748-Amphidinium_carterae.1